MVLSVSLPVLNFFFDTYIRLRSCKESYNIYGAASNLYGAISGKTYSLSQVYTQFDTYKADFVAANNAATEIEKADKWVEIMLKLGELGNSSQSEAYNDSLLCETANACRTIIYDTLKRTPAGLAALTRKIAELNATAATPLDASKRLRYLAYLYHYEKLNETIIKDNFRSFTVSKAKIVTSTINDVNAIFPDVLKPNFFQIFVKVHMDMGHLPTDELIRNITTMYCTNLGLTVPPAVLVRQVEAVNDSKQDISGGEQKKDKDHMPPNTSQSAANDGDNKDNGSSDPAAARGEKEKQLQKPSLFPPAPSLTTSSGPVELPASTHSTANGI